MRMIWKTVPANNAHRIIPAVQQKRNDLCTKTLCRTRDGRARRGWSIRKDHHLMYVNKLFVNACEYALAASGDVCLAGVADFFRGIQMGSLPIGARVSEFDIHEVIGRGGTGIVYLANDGILCRKVALKEFMPGYAVRSGERVVCTSTTDDVSFREGVMRFGQEARILANFSCPALSGVLQFVEANGTAYIVLPYYQGETMLARLEKGYRVDNGKQLLSIVHPLLRGLSVVHMAGYCHLDISPDNIIFKDKDDRPVLIDFGSACRVDAGKSGNSQVGVKDGFTPIEGYEVGRALGMGSWSDVYALSAVCYQLVTGNVPELSIARMRCDELEPLTQYATSVLPLDMLKAIDAGLAVMPGDRPCSVREFGRMLSSALAGGGKTSDDAKDEAKRKIISPRISRWKQLNKCFRVPPRSVSMCN
jgi:serine/threonine protein kinase